MASIGPQLPSHMQKRKRPADEEGEKTSQIKKHQYGPQLPDSNSNSDSDFGLANNPTIGPSNPVLGPVAPPANPAQSDPLPSAPPPRRVAGPALPSSADNVSDDPEPFQEKKNISPSLLPPSSTLIDQDFKADSASDSDSDYGPSLPTSASYARRAAQHYASVAPVHDALENAGPKRDEWMLVPPSESSASRREVDPTRIRARKFASGPRANTTVSDPQKVSNSLWTETVAEKAKRIADEVLGRGPDPDALSNRRTQPNSGMKSRTSEAEDARVRANIAAARGPSLMESHRQSNAKKIMEEEEKDDPSKRAFDREKDMAIGGRGAGAWNQKEVLKQAKNFGGRFGNGSFL